MYSAARVIIVKTLLFMRNRFLFFGALLRREFLRRGNKGDRNGAKQRLLILQERFIGETTRGRLYFPDA